MTVTQALGWALVHSLWQCALAAAALAALLAVLPARAARIRYALAAVTLALTLALPLGTWLRPHRAPARQPPGAPAPIDAGAGARRARVGAPRDPAARQRPDGAHPAAARGTARPRAGSCAPLRLPRQLDPVGDRNAAVLPSGGVVDLRAGA